MEEIEIVHTNDLHSHLEHWPKISRFINQKQKSDRFTLTFDIGDFMDRSHPLTEATDGHINVDLINAAHYDAVTIGNNEGIGNSHEVLEHLFDDAKFDVILANLYEKSGELAKFAIPYKIYQSNSGIKVGVIGLTAVFPLTYGPNGWDIRLIQQTLPPILKKLKEECNIVVLLSHLGINTDKFLAQKYPDLDLIIGSHTHHHLPNGLKIGKTWIAAADRYGNFVGTIKIKFDDNQRLNDIFIKTVDVNSLAQESGDESTINSWLNEGHRILKQRVITDYKKEKPDIDILVDAICKYTNTDIGILNTGLFVGSLPKGELNFDDLHSILPHPMHVVKVTLSGADLWRMIMEMEKNRNYLRNFPIKGMSFRGKIFGEITYKGITVDMQERIVYVNGIEIDTNKEYSFATVDHYVFIPFFPTIEIMGKTKFFFPYFLRDVFAKYLD